MLLKIGFVSRIGEFPEKEWEKEFAIAKMMRASHLELIVNYPFFGPKTHTKEQIDKIRKLAEESGVELILHLLPNQYQLPEGVRYTDSSKEFQEHEQYLKTKLFNIASENEQVRKFSLEEVERTIGMARGLGAGLITIHGGSFSDEDYKNALTRSRKSLEYLNTLLGDVKICVENLPTLGHSWSPPRELPIYPRDLVYLVEGLDCIGITFDTGHANTVGNVLEFYKEISKTGKVWDMHLHDNLGERDSHLPIGRGNIDWKNFLRMLIREDYKGFAGIELDTWNETPEPMKSTERTEGFGYLIRL